MTRSGTTPAIGQESLTEVTLSPTHGADLLTTAETVPVSGLKQTTLEKYRTSGPPFVRIDGRVFYERSKVLQWRANRGISAQEGDNTEPDLPWSELAALADQLDVILGTRKFR